MFLTSKQISARVAILIGLGIACSGPVNAQSIVLSPWTNGGDFEGTTVCTNLGGLFHSGDSGECEADDSVIPDTMTFESGTELETLAGSVANFGGAVNFNSNNVQFNSSNVAFGGGNTSFNSTVTFTGPSATFSTPTTFQNPATFNGTTNFTAGMTTTNITNSGTINSTNVNVTGSFTAAPGTTINMGGVNRIQGVAAGINDLDAVNVAQLNAATSGIATDITALETTTATHTTQIATHTTQIATLETTTATHTTQITALQAADMALDVRMDAMELLAEGLDDRIGKVDDRASAGTAAAVALSGAMFLPGKSFNLTGNVGSYRGAHAAALQFGALVSDNVAINAGIGHGFNKGGKTALRAGFTIGW